LLLEPLLAYAHFVAMLMLVVFLGSEAALCRYEWLNNEAVRRLARVDRLCLFAALAVLVTGFARTYWGAKGFAWYWSQPLLRVKVGLFVAIGLISVKPTLAIQRWRTSVEGGRGLPSQYEIRGIRRRVMLQAHLLLLVPLAAVFLARGTFSAG
jgi:putative membrane protein